MTGQFSLDCQAANIAVPLIQPLSNATSGSGRRFEKRPGPPPAIWIAARIVPDGAVHDQLLQSSCELNPRATPWLRVVGELASMLELCAASCQVAVNADRAGNGRLAGRLSCMFLAEKR